MKVLSYIASLLCLYLMAQAWGFLWDIHFLLPIGIIVTMLAIGMVMLVTAEDRKKARSDRIFEEMSDQYERQECDK
jgi:hypothetical protein